MARSKYIYLIVNCTEDPAPHAPFTVKHECISYIKNSGDIFDWENNNLYFVWRFRDGGDRYTEFTLKEFVGES